ncbi:hypothetical protein [Streptomonospora salina]
MSSAGSAPDAQPDAAGGAEFAVEPVGACATMLRPCCSWTAWGAAYYVVMAASEGEPFGWPLQALALFVAAGILRGLYLLVFFGGHALRIDGDGVELATRRRSRRIPASVVTELSLKTPHQGWGFSCVEVETVRDKRIVHRIAVFGGGMTDKQTEFERVAPRLGFRMLDRPWTWAR